MPWSYKALCSEFKGDAVKDELAPWRSQVPVGSYQAGLEALGRALQNFTRGPQNRPPRRVPPVPRQGSLPRVGDLPAPADQVGAPGRVRPAARPDPYQGADVEADPAARARRAGAHHARHGQPLGRELVRQLHGRALAQAAPRAAPGRGRGCRRRPDAAGDAVGRASRSRTRVRCRRRCASCGGSSGSSTASGAPATPATTCPTGASSRARRAGSSRSGCCAPRPASRRLHERVANLRREQAHQLTTYLTREFGVIGVETLNVRGPAGQPPARAPHRRRRLGHDADPAEVQDLLVRRLPAGRRRPFLPLLEDLLGLRDSESQAGPVRARLQL